MKPNPSFPLRKNEVIQIALSHKWGACLAVVDEPKSFGCVASVRAPIAGGNGIGEFPIRLAWDDFERLAANGIDAVFVVAES